VILDDGQPVAGRRDNAGSVVKGGRFTLPEGQIRDALAGDDPVRKPCREGKDPVRVIL
jgi:hypothetical protein